MTIVGRWLLAIDMQKQQLLLTAADADGKAVAGAQSVVMSSPADARNGVSPQGGELKPSLFPLGSPVVDNITDALSMAASYSSPAPLQLQAHAQKSPSKQNRHQHSPAPLEDDLGSFEVSSPLHHVVLSCRCIAYTCSVCPAIRAGCALDSCNPGALTFSSRSSVAQSLS